MKRTMRAPALGLLIFLPYACSGGDDSHDGVASLDHSAWTAVEPVGSEEAAHQRSVATAELAVVDDGGSSALPVDMGLVAPAGRQIIRDVTIDLEVADVSEARRAIASLVERSGGFISHLDLGRAGDTGHARFTLRIPAARVGSISAELGQIGRVLGERHGSQDITQQYLDTETRLRVLRETDARLRTILSSRTGKLADVLQVERELSRVVTEIERLEGQRRFWDEQVELATVQVAVSEPVPVIRAGWTAPVVEAFRSSLGVLARSAGAVITLIAGALPFAVLALVGWALWRGFRSVPGVNHRTAS